MATETVTAISDLGVMLWHYDSAKSKYMYLVPVKAAPATGGAPAQIEVTELDSTYKQYILDREETPAYEFTYNYTNENYSKVKTVCDGKTQNKFLLTFGNKSGFKFDGMGATWTEAVSAGSQIDAMISIAVSKKEWVDDCTSEVDVESIPTGKSNPFGTTATT